MKFGRSCGVNFYLFNYLFVYFLPFIYSFIILIYFQLKNLFIFGRVNFFFFLIMREGWSCLICYDFPLEMCSADYKRKINYPHTRFYTVYTRPIYFSGLWIYFSHSNDDVGIIYIHIGMYTCRFRYGITSHTSWPPKILKSGHAGVLLAITLIYLHINSQLHIHVANKVKNEKEIQR